MTPYPTSGFERLDSRVQRWLWEQKWGALRPVQEGAIHAILDSDRDVLLSAPTASGKTEAAFLPLCTRLLAARDDKATTAQGIDLLYISPLKALINDQWGRLDALCEWLDIPVNRWHGDVSASGKARVLSHPEGILLITPESLEALFVLRGTQINRLLGNLQAVVVDELHAFFGNERGRQMQSLLHRIEARTGRVVRRVGLSATLSDTGQASGFLRPGAGEQVVVVAPDEGSQEIQVQVRGYVIHAPHKPAPLPVTPDEAETDETPDDPEADDESASQIADDLYRTLRGSHNLVFANSRHAVETFAVALARRSEENHVPNEFVPHHGSLSRTLREDAEARLREGERPATAVCTSTLEMGIDIGPMQSVAQIGVAPSVTALRQRVGRSGRRGAPCQLRVYVREIEVTPMTALLDLLRQETFAAAAQLTLLAQGWCEPPEVGGLHLSTLTQQTLSVIAERSGCRPNILWKLLCDTGPFRQIDQTMYADFLRALHKTGLVAQMDDGSLLLGPTGERIVGHYSFYAAFNTPEEYRLVAQGRTLGTLPVTQPLLVDSFLVYAGRRWRVMDINEEQRVVDLLPARGGRPPAFGGDGFQTDEAVRQTMLALYDSETTPPFLNKAARALFAQGRENFRRYDLANRRIVTQGDTTSVFLWSSDRVCATLFLEFAHRGFKAEAGGISVNLQRADETDIRHALKQIAEGVIAPPEALAALVAHPDTEKYDRYLSPPLKARDYAARALDVAGACRVAGEVVSSKTSP